MRPHLTILSQDETTTHLRGRCPITQDSWELIVDTASMKRWDEGQLVQEAFANLSADDRELLLTGITPRGWDVLFSAEVVDEDADEDAMEPVMQEDNVMCPVCKTGHHVEGAEPGYLAHEECSMEEEEADDTVSVLDCGFSMKKGHYMVCSLANHTEETLANAYNKFYEIHKIFPVSRDKIYWGETTYYSTDAGERGCFD